MTAIAPEALDPAVPHAVQRRRGVAWRIVLLALAAAVAVLLGANVDTVGYLLPVTVAAGLCAMFVLSRLALERFEWFIWVVLLTRPLMDLAKPDIHDVGPTSQLATVVGGVVIVAGTVWFAAISRKGERLPMGVVSRALVLLTATSMISVAVSSQPTVSFMQVARTTGAVVVFIVLEQLLRTRRMAMQTLAVCGLSAAVPLLVGLGQVPYQISIVGLAGMRIHGTFLHPNSFGLFLVFLILVLYALRRHLTGRVRWAATITLVVALGELLLTQSRGSWFTLVLGIAVIGLLLKEERKIFWIGPALVALTALAFPTAVARVTDLGTEDTLNGNPANSASWRLNHYEVLLDKTDISVFGIGPRMTMGLTEGGGPPHNDALRLLLENGVVGLFCYVLLIIGLIMVARLGLRHLHARFDRALAAGYTAVIVAFVFNSMGSNLITQFVLLIYLFALAAVIQALAHLAVNSTAGRSVHGNP